MFTNSYKYTTKKSVAKVGQKLDLQAEGVVKEFKHALDLKAKEKAQAIYSANADLHVVLDDILASHIEKF